MSKPIIDLDQRLEEFYLDCPEARGHGVHISCLLTEEEMEEIMPTPVHTQQKFTITALG